MMQRSKELTSKEISLLKSYFETFKFNNSFDLVYESQVPNTGIVVLSGSLELFRNKKIKFSIKPGIMLGISMVLYNTPSTMRCRVVENSEILLIHKSDIVKTLADKKSKLYSLIKEVVASTRF